MAVRLHWLLMSGCACCIPTNISKRQAVPHIADLLTY